MLEVARDERPSGGSLTFEVTVSMAAETRLAASGAPTEHNFSKLETASFPSKRGSSLGGFASAALRRIKASRSWVVRGA